MMHPQLIDVSSSRRIDTGLLAAALAGAVRWGGPAPDLDAYARHVDGMAQQSAHAAGVRLQLSAPVLDLARRADALPGGAGGFPRDFEFIRTQIFEEARQPLTAMSYFPTDTSVPLGARSHTARRSLGSGEAQIYGPGSEIPRARTTYAEETFGVAYVVCAVDTNFFEALTTDWAGLSQYQRDMRLAVRLVEERLNRIAWFGDVGSQLAGVTTYPSLAKQVMSTAWSDASTPEDIATGLADLVNTPMIESGAAFSPNQLLVSPRQHAFLFSRKHSTTGGSDLTIGAFFLLGQAASGQGIKSIRPAPELSGIGPSGEDGVLAYRDDLASLGNVMIQAPTALPVYQSSPLDQTTVVFAATGGVVMPDVGNAILGYAPNA